MTLLRSKKSPLLSAAALTGVNQSGNPLAPVREAVAAIVKLVSEAPDASFADVLQCAAKHHLFPIPKSLEPFAVALDGTDIATEFDDDDEPETEPESQSRALESLREFLETPFLQVKAYIDYIGDSGDFDTHQGVKGREFERVLVVMDDADARGFLFSYEKLFAVKTPTSTDNRNIAAGKETSEDRTRRLFYVTCTRAEKSLALVAYTENPELLASTVINKGWFEQDEIISL